MAVEWPLFCRRLLLLLLFFGLLPTATPHISALRSRPHLPASQPMWQWGWGAAALAPIQCNTMSRATIDFPMAKIAHTLKRQINRHLFSFETNCNMFYMNVVKGECFGILKEVLPQRKATFGMSKMFTLMGFCVSRSLLYYEYICIMVQN